MKRFLSIIILTGLVQFQLWGQCGAGETQIIFEIDSLGNFPEEISWRLIDESTENEVFSKQAGFLTSNVIRDTLCLSDNSTYRFEAYDGYGDGWGGNEYNIYYADGFVLKSGMPDNGEAGQGQSQLEEAYAFTVGERPGEDCTMPAPINVNETFSVNTALYSNSYVLDPLFDSGKEAIFQFTPSVTDNYSILLTNFASLDQGSLQLFDNCYDSNPTRISFDSTGFVNDTLQIVETLTEGSTYFVVVSNNLSSGTDGIQADLSINYSGDPINTSCANGFNLTVNGAPVSSRLYSPTPSQTPFFSLTSADSTVYESFAGPLTYNFTLASQQNIAIELEGYNEFETSFIELVKQETCLDGPETTYKRVITEGASRVFAFDNLVAGTYRLNIYLPSFPSNGSFQVSAKTFANMNTAVNQDCSTAINTNIIQTNQSYVPNDIQWISLFNGSNSGLAAPCGQDSIFTASTADVWLKAQVPSSRNLAIQTFGELYDVFTASDQALETRFSVYSGACGSLTEVYCSDKFENHQSDTLSNLNAGEEVYIRFWDRNGDDSGEIGVILSDPGALPKPQISVESFSDSLSVNFDYFSESLIFDYNVRVSADSFATFLPSFNPAVVSSMDGQLGIPGLNPATTYYIQTWSSKEGFTNSDTTVIQVKSAALTINSIADGNWSDPNIWEGSVVPPADSAVNIQHKVTINAGENFNINQVTIRGDGDSTANVGIWMNNGELFVENSVLVTTSSAIPTDSVGIFISSDGTSSSALRVGTDLIFDISDEAAGDQLQFSAINNGDSIIIDVANEFAFRHNGTDSTQSYTEPNINFQSVDLRVGGNLFFYNSSFNADQPFNAVFTDSRITADVFNLNALQNTNGEFQVNFNGSTVVDLNFHFQRPGNGGKIQFNDQSILRFNGLDYQEITGFGQAQDSIIYNNVVVNVETDIFYGRETPILKIIPSYEELFTKVLIEGELNLINGVVTDELDYFDVVSSEVIFGQNASVIGTNSSSFIKETTSKIGNTPFTFPVGSDLGLKQIRILNNEEFQLTDKVIISSFDNSCGLLDSAITNSSLVRDRTEEFWQLRAELSDVNVAANFEPIIPEPLKQGVTNFSALELVNFNNGNSLGNGSITDSSFVTATEYNFSIADTTRFGLASNLQNENPFYEGKTILNLSTYAGAPGDSVTINYSASFASAADKVYIGGKLAPVLSNTANSITVSVPEGARSGSVELIYGTDQIAYSHQNFIIKYPNTSPIISNNYTNLSAIDTINGSVLLGQTEMQIGQIDNDNNFDAMIVSQDYQSVTLVKNLSGTISKQEFNVFNEGTQINPTKFQLGLSNFNKTVGLDAIIEFDVNGDNGLLYYQNDGFGNFSQYQEGEANNETVYNDYVFNDISLDGISDPLFSVYNVSSNSSMISVGNNGETCDPNNNSTLPFFEPSNKNVSSILLGDFIDNGSMDIRFLVREESIIGMLDLYSQDTLFYYSNNSRTANQIFEIKNISLLKDGFSQIVASNQSTNEIEIYSFNNGTLSIDLTTVPLSFTPAKMDAEDINGDGFQDLIVSNQNTASLHVLLNNGAGQLTEELALSYAGGIIADFDVLDLNNDGVKDFLILQEGGQLSAAYYEILNLNTPVISASNITTSSFDLAWDSVENAVEYEIFISKENDTIADLPTDSILIAGDTALSFQAPSPFETYYVFGRAISSAGDTSVFSNPVVVNLLTLDSLTFQAQNITNSGFDLTWGSIANADSYEIIVSLQDSPTAGLDSDSIYQVSDTILNFNAPIDFESYFVFGRAISAQGDTANFWSSFQVQLENIQIPAPTASNLNSNGFDLSWSAIAGADQYEIYIGTNSDTASLGENDSLFVVSNSNISYQAPEYSELYFFNVRAISNTGDTSVFSIQDSVKLPLSSYLQQDSLALVSLYETNGGVNWVNNQNWLTGKLNTWEGLVMNADSLFAINLPSNQLDGMLTSALDSLNFIREIDFSNNNLTDVSALENQINNLNILNLSGNSLSFEQLEGFTTIPNFNYNNQNFEYNLPIEIFESLGTDISISVQANASANTFQWYKDSVQIAGETTQTLNLPNAQRSDEGFYYVEINNSNLPDLTLISTATEVKISSLERDVIALRQFYDSTNGDGWSTINWDTTSENPTEWSTNDQDIIVENNRVVEINLSDNNLTGSVPSVLNEVLGLRTINLENNALESTADLTELPNLTTLNLSGNALGYDDLERNIAIEGFEFSNQANFGNEPGQKIAQGSSFTLNFEVKGSANVYKWYRNDVLISNADTSEFTIDSITFETMGEYRLEVENEIVNAVNPEFKLISNPVNIIAFSTIRGRVQDANEFATESGRVYLYKQAEDGSFDSLRLNNNSFFQNIQNDGSFEIQNVELGDYIVYVNNDENSYPDLLNTYYPNTIDWELAEIVSLRSNINDLIITMEGEPQELSGTSVLAGYLEEEYNEGERQLPRRRVSGVGVSVRTLVGSSRDISFRSILENNELVAYLETDENGEFQIPNLPAGNYTIKFDIPGVPMNEQSDVTFNLTGEDQEALEIAAVSDNGQISVTRVSYTANKSELLKNVTVYPNPSNAKFNINGTESILSVKVISSEGRLVKELSGFNDSMQNVQVDLGDYPDGMYFMQIVWKDGFRSMNKLIKK